MKIFITGATGFIGTHLTELLITEGYEVTVLLRSEAKREKLPSTVSVIKGDLSLFEDKSLQLPIFDVIIHLAGVIFEKDREGYFKYNFEAVKHLVDCLNRQSWSPKRFVFASSLAAAGPSQPGVTLTEKDTPAPIDHYGDAKLEAEKFLDTLVEFPTTVFRPGIVLGPGDENSLTLFKMAKSHLGISVDGKPQHMSFVDVDDLNQAIRLMVLDPSSENRKFFVAHPEACSNHKLFRTLGQVMEKHVFMLPLPKPVLFVAMHASTLVSGMLGIKNQLDSKQYQQLTHHFVCSGAALTKTLGWQPKYDLESSIRKAYLGYKRTGML